MNHIRKHTLFIVTLATLLILLGFVMVSDAQLIIHDHQLRPAEPIGDAYIQGNDEYQRVQDNIIRTADFEKVRDLPADSLDYQLSQKVGWIAIPHPTYIDVYQYCTGFLVGPDLFLTNHHCIHDNFGALPLDGVLVFMDYYLESRDDPTRGGVSAGVSEILHAETQKDYALLRLDAPIGNAYGWLELDTTGVFDSSQSVKLISHPRGRSKEIVRRNSEIVDLPAGISISSFGIAYLADTEPGASGSPIFLRDGSSVIGIHHSGWTRRGLPIFNAGSLMSHIVPEIQAWLPNPVASDLSVSNPQISKNYLMPSEPFSMSVDVTNSGVIASESTTLRVYQSFDDVITADDTEVGTAVVDVLNAGLTTEISIMLTAPVTLGTHYFGACVDAISNDLRVDNNCSAALRLLVSAEAEPTKIYWTQNSTWKSQIYRSNLDGTNIEELLNTFNGVSDPRHIAVDISESKMYWVNSGSHKIQRANLDGRNIEDIVVALVGEEESYNSIALDLTNRKIYWNNLSRSIQRANLDGTDIETVVSGLLGLLPSIALDLSARKIYWSLSLQKKIQRSNLDGTDIETLITGLGSGGILTSIALDVSVRKLYWSHIDSSNNGKIQRSNLDGTDIETLVTGLDTPTSIALHTEAGKVYWSDSGTHSIQRANPDGSGIEVLLTEIGSPNGIALGIEPPPITSPPPEPPTEPPDEPTSLDVNGDGQVNILDLIWIAVFYGQQGSGLAADVNQDGIVNVQDFIAVAAVVDATEILSIEAALAKVEALAGAPSVEIQTQLLPNYPNPSNPETWMPYSLSEPTNVEILIHSVNGKLVRTLPIGYQNAGIYVEKHRAAYWDGRNNYGEPVASGVYFYTLTTDEFTATQKMLIRK